MIPLQGPLEVRFAPSPAFRRRARLPLTRRRPRRAPAGSVRKPTVRRPGRQPLLAGPESRGAGSRLGRSEGPRRAAPKSEGLSARTGRRTRSDRGHRRPDHASFHTTRRWRRSDGGPLAVAARGAAEVAARSEERASWEVRLDVGRRSRTRIMIRGDRPNRRWQFAKQRRIPSCSRNVRSSSRRRRPGRSWGVAGSPQWGGAAGPCSWPATGRRGPVPSGAGGPRELWRPAARRLSPSARRRRRCTVPRRRPRAGGEHDRRGFALQGRVRS